MDLSTITPTTFKAFFVRDFTYLPLDTPLSEVCNDQSYVLDSDITRAFMEAQAVFNQGLFDSDQTITLAYLYLTAHYLVNDLRAAQDALGSTGAFPVNSRSVGNVSESYTIPQRYIDSPSLFYFTSSAYGMKYLSILVPNLVGNVFPVCGGTNP